MRRLLAALFAFVFTAQAAAQDLNALLNAQFGTTPGLMLQRGPSTWQPLSAGAVNSYLVSNGAGQPVRWSTDQFPWGLTSIATNRVMGNVTGGNSVPTPIDVSQFLNTIGYDIIRPPVPGSLLYKANDGTWQALSWGPIGWVLQSNGQTQRPDWAARVPAPPSVSITGDHPVTSSDCYHTFELSGGTFFTFTLGDPTGFPVGCTMTIINTEAFPGRGKKLPIFGFSTRILNAGQWVTVTYDGGSIWTPNPAVQQVWERPDSFPQIIFYVSTSGLSTNDGLGGCGAGGAPFDSNFTAYTYIVNNVGIRSQDPVYIVNCPGTYVGSAAYALHAASNIPRRNGDEGIWFTGPLSHYDGQGSAVFTGSTSGTTLTVTAVTSGTILVGDFLYDPASNLSVVGAVTALGSGTGGTGTYTISTSPGLSSRLLETSPCIDAGAVHIALDGSPAFDAEEGYTVMGAGCMLITNTASQPLVSANRNAVIMLETGLRLGASGAGTSQLNAGNGGRIYQKAPLVVTSNSSGNTGYWLLLGADGRYQSFGNKIIFNNGVSSGYGYDAMVRMNEGAKAFFDGSTFVIPGGLTGLKFQMDTQTFFSTGGTGNLNFIPSGTPGIFAGNSCYDNQCGGPWTGWTPTLSCGTGTLNSAAATAASFETVGKTVRGSFTITITLNGSCAGNLIFTLPSNVNAFAMGVAAQVALGGKSARVQMNSGGNLAHILTYDNLYPGADGEIIVGSFQYEAQ